MADDEQDPEGQEPEPSPKDLRAAAADGKRARAEAEAAKRELAFHKAGINTDSTAGKMFMQFYEGDLEAAAIKAGFAELGIGPPSAEPPPNQQQLTPEELAQTQQRAALATESGAPGDGSKHPWDTAYDSFNQARRDGTPVEMAFGAAVGHIIGAANAGDERVLIRDNPYRDAH